VDSAEQHDAVKNALEGDVGFVRIAGFERGHLSDGGFWLPRLRMVKRTVWRSSSQCSSSFGIL
jgi:hypothetical protein